jgi:hypothetical protein
MFARERIEMMRRKEGSILYAPPAKPHVTPQIAARVTRTFEVQQPPLHEPVYLELDARVDKVVEVAVGVFERQRIGIGEMFGDEEVDLGRQGGEGRFGPGGKRSGCLCRRRFLI